MQCRRVEDARRNPTSQNPWRRLYSSVSTLFVSHEIPRPPSPVLDQSALLRLSHQLCLPILVSSRFSVCDLVPSCLRYAFVAPLALPLSRWSRLVQGCPGFSLVSVVGNSRLLLHDSSCSFLFHDWLIENCVLGGCKIFEGFFLNVFYGTNS